WRFFWALTASQLANTVFPGRMGPVARILLIGESMGKTASLCTVVLEKALEALTLLAAFLLAVPALQSSDWLWPEVLTSAALFALILAAVILVAGQRQRILRWADRWRWSRAFIDPLSTALETLDVARQPRMLLELGLWSALIWVLTVLMDYWLLLAMGIHVPLTAAWLLNVFVQVGVRVPSLPASIGVFHYMTIVALGLFGVNESLALSYALVLHVLIFFPPSIAAVFYLWHQGYDWRAWRWAKGDSA
ncbi:MAG: flippase-like domain-containing protein, partial [Chloroflexi bacterium]|nr:flippase-like domain-containing protein [Chloroflexota bacterium]